tara:strand:- start:75 stop:551 length:477 start_codon:yes stop_codon:yes gene_type:complete
MIYKDKYIFYIKKILFLCLFLCLGSSFLIAQEVYIEEHKGEIIYNPCGKDGKQLDSLTAYFQYEFNAEYKNLNKGEINNFLKRIKQEDSDIVSVRVFKSPLHSSYAIISSYLFQNFLNGNIIVELYCVKKLNGALALFIKEDKFEEFIGESFLQLGIE